MSQYMLSGVKRLDLVVTDLADFCIVKFWCMLLMSFYVPDDKPR